MGLFGNLGGKSPLEKDFNIHEAVSGVLLSVVASDGDISDEEVDAFNFVVNRHAIFSSQAPHDFRKMIDAQFSILRKNGWETLAEKAASHVPPNLSGTVFALAVDFVLADGQVESAEEQLIESLRRKLGIDEDDAKSVIQVLALKNGV
ncbi:tellurite resistance TerB family protein [Stappia sp. ES.058]|uniref:tellurite resistance TerB family protein n=1 Tax=Stappia sp. ES.058 TaxID=1881061 RepID=UPI00087D01D6|nr:tellurite resistance TerB family protein [Stappia sp. ES.058]SDU00376.1 Tellurite resistance protein TerB [Stappia sp. ES.058]